MFMGHYAAAYVARSFEPRLSLAAAFIGAELVDIAWGVTMLTGLEHGRIDASLPSNPLVMEYMPYTHSVLGSLGFAAVAYGVARATRWDARVALALAATVVSHWLLDVVVHRPDMTLWGAPPYLGLSLWNWPVVAALFEVGVLIGAAAFHYRKVGGSAAVQGGILGALLVLQVIATFGPPPTSIRTFAALAVPFYLAVSGGVAYLARFDHPAA